MLLTQVYLKKLGISDIVPFYLILGDLQSFSTTGKIIIFKKLQKTKKKKTKKSFFLSHQI